MRYLGSVVLALATVVAPSLASAQTAANARTLELTFNGGLVTLVARNVTVNEIMSEWARQGGSKVTNADKLTGTAVSYEFHNAPEAVVLQSVLRSAAGYIAAPRRAGGTTGPSIIEQLIILPTSRPSANAVITMPTNLMQQNPQIYQGTPDDDIPPVRPEQSQQQDTPPPQPGGRPQTPSTQPTVGGVGTSMTPGVVIAPVKPGTPVAPGTIIKTPVA
jgi:hypothetical protein